MQSTPYSSSTSVPWLIPDNANMATNNISNFWSNGGYRKRKVDTADLGDSRENQKMFVTEEKMVKEMQTLSLELLPPDISGMTLLNPVVNEVPFVDEEPLADESNTCNGKSSIKTDYDENDDDDDDDEEKNRSATNEPQLELHKLLKDSFKKDDMNDSLLKKLCDNERRKLSMQLVPYIPVHPAQLTSEATIKFDTTEEDEKEKLEDKSTDSESYLIDTSDEVKIEDTDYIFKVPFTPTAYTVEEPSGDAELKRVAPIKRSYSQSNQSSGSLLVTELKPDAVEFLATPDSRTSYFIVEPTINSLSNATSFPSNSSMSCDASSIRISELVENPSSYGDIPSVLDDDDIDMQSVASSDTGDKMDDE